MASSSAGGTEWVDPFGADDTPPDTPPDTPRSSSPARVPLGDRVPTLIAKGLSLRQFNHFVKDNRTATGDGRSGGGGDVEMGSTAVGMTYTTLAGEPIEEVPLCMSSAAHHSPRHAPHQPRRPQQGSFLLLLTMLVHHRDDRLSPFRNRRSSRTLTTWLISPTPASHSSPRT